MKNKMMFDQIIVIDIESTCWKERAPKGQINEIIEIGITPVETKSGSLLETTDIIVRPENSVISDFCTSLTTLTQEQVDLGISFKDACKILTDKLMTKDRIWASYGNYDKNRFEEQCIREKIGYPFGDNHINVKVLLAAIYSLHRQVGMSGALDMLRIPLEGTHHRGNDDSRNIAKILSRLLFKYKEETICR